MTNQHTPSSRILAAKTETEAVDRALSIVVSEADIDKALEKVRGKGRIRKVFRWNATVIIDVNVYIGWINDGLYEAVILQRDAIYGELGRSDKRSKTYC